MVRVALVLACVLVPAASASAAVTGTFRGRTSDGKRVVFRIRHGRALPPSAVPYVGTCGQGTDSGTISARGRMRSAHRFAATFNGLRGPVDNVRSRAHAVIRFVVHGRRLRGSVVVHDTILALDGAVLDHCSARVTFSARARPAHPPRRAAGRRGR